MLSQEEFASLHKNWISAFGKKICGKTITSKFPTRFHWVKVLKTVAEQKGAIVCGLLPHYKSKNGSYFEVLPNCTEYSVDIMLDNFPINRYRVFVGTEQHKKTKFSMLDLNY